MEAVEETHEKYGDYPPEAALYQALSHPFTASFEVPYPAWFSTFDEHIISVDSENLIEIWSWADDLEQEGLYLGDTQFSSIDIAYDKGLLVTSDKNNKVKLWNLGKRELIKEFTLDSGNLAGFNETGEKILLSNLYENKVSIWNWNNNTINKIPVESGGKFARFGNDDTIIVASDNDIRVFTSEGTDLFQFGIESMQINDVSPDGRSFLSGGCRIAEIDGKYCTAGYANAWIENNLYTNLYENMYTIAYHHSDVIKAKFNDTVSSFATLDAAGNVSFGLPDRQTLNQAFLAVAISRGASCAITNPSRLTTLVRATDLLLGRDLYSMNYIKHYRAQEKRKKGAGK